MSAPFFSLFTPRTHGPRGDGKNGTEAHILARGCVGCSIPPPSEATAGLLQDEPQDSQRKALQGRSDHAEHVF
eukprot:2744417-Pyramimonas_sp.AAC.1